MGIGALALVIVGGVGGFWLGVQQGGTASKGVSNSIEESMKVSPTLPATSTEMQSEVPEGWLEYSDEVLGISFYYPPGMLIERMPETYGGHLQVGKLLRFSPAIDVRSSGYYQQNTELYTENPSEMSPITMSGKKVTALKANWESGGGGVAIQQLSYYFELPDSFLAVIAVSHEFTYDDANPEQKQKIASYVNAPNGDRVSVTDADIQTARQILSTVRSN